MSLEQRFGEIRVASDGIALPMNKEYLNRKKCQALAKVMLAHQMIQGMSCRQIAVEIYAHAILFYRFKFVSHIPVYGKQWLQYLLDKAVSIEIQHGGDRWYRRLAYNLLWLC